MLALDAAPYANRWRYRNPAEKALLSLGLLVLVLVLPVWPGAALCGGVAVIALLGPARVPAVLLWRVVRIPAGFVLTGALPLLVAVGGEPWLRWAPEGLPQAAQLVGRALAGLLCLLVLAATTPMSDLLPRLERIGVPAAVTEVASLIYRMLFLLLTSLRTVREAQAGRLGFRTWATSYRSLAGQGAAVFVRAFDRARRLEQGLAVRGYTGSLAVQVAERPVARGFVLGTLVLLAAVATVGLAVGGMR